MASITKGQALRAYLNQEANVQGTTGNSNYKDRIGTINPKAKALQDFMKSQQNSMLTMSGRGGSRTHKKSRHHKKSKKSKKSKRSKKH